MPSNSVCAILPPKTGLASQPPSRVRALRPAQPPRTSRPGVALARAAFSEQASAILAATDSSFADADLTTLAEWLARRFLTEINERRQRDLGVTHYIWRSRDDPKVRMIPRLIDHNPWTLSRIPMEVMRDGQSVRRFQALQQ